MKKEIKFLYDTKKSGVEFKKYSTYTVSILKMDVCGYLERYGSEMEGCFGYYALCEFENGKIMSFQIDSEIHILGDSE